MITISINRITYFSKEYHYLCLLVFSAVLAGCSGFKFQANQPNSNHNNLLNTVPTPNGISVAADCVRQVASGSTIDQTGLAVKASDGSSQIFSECSTPVPANLNDQWLEYGFTEQGAGFSALSGSWTVPSAPTSNSGQMLFLFNGLTAADNSCIIQPVLGWSAINGWTAESWVCCSATSTGCYHSQPITVSTGDYIKGSMTLDSTTSTWSIVTQDSTTGQSTSISVAASLIGGSQVFAYPAALEVYTQNEDDCTNYFASSSSVASIAFSNTSYVVSGNSNPTPQVVMPKVGISSCGEKVTTNGTGSLVTLSIENVNQTLPGGCAIANGTGVLNSAGQCVVSTCDTSFHVNSTTNTCDYNSCDYGYTYEGGSCVATAPPPTSVCQTGSYEASSQGSPFGYITVSSVGTYGEMTGTFNNGAAGAGPFYNITGACVDGSISFRLMNSANTAIEVWEGTYDTNGNMNGSFSYSGQTVQWTAQPAAAVTNNVCQLGSYQISTGGSPFGFITINSVAADGTMSGLYNNGSAGQGPFYNISGSCLNWSINFNLYNSSNALIEVWSGSYLSNGNMNGSFTYNSQTIPWTAGKLVDGGGSGTGFY